MARQEHEPTNWDGKERRSYVVLSAGQIEEMLEESSRRGAEKAFQEIYALIGAGVVKKTLLLLGAAGLAFFAWITNPGGITIPAIGQTYEARK